MTNVNPTVLSDIVPKVSHLAEVLGVDLQERETQIENSLLALTACTTHFQLGVPGTAKSLLPALHSAREQQKSTTCMLRVARANGRLPVPSRGS